MSGFGRDRDEAPVMDGSTLQLRVNALDRSDADPHCGDKLCLS
jgi:hypothetical protein